MLFEENEELTSVLGNAGSEFGPTSLITTSKSVLNPWWRKRGKGDQMTLLHDTVVFTNKRSQAGVSTVYFTLNIWKTKRTIVHVRSLSGV